MRVIDELEAKKHPGQIIQLFEFRGRIWRPLTGPDGEPQLSKSKDSTSVLIAARNIWEAHEYVHTHIPGLVPITISHHDDVWLTMETANKMTSE